MDLQTVQQQRIQMLEEQLKQHQKPMVNQPVLNQPESMEAIVSRLIDEKLQHLSNQVTQQVQQTQAEPIDYGTQLLVAVGSALTEEQQVWLSDVNNRAAIPEFLMSNDGQAITRRFMSLYKQYRTSQCK